MLLAFQIRSNKEITVMGGTIIGVVTCMQYLTAIFCFTIFDYLGLNHRFLQHESMADYLKQENEIRLYRIGLVVIANIFFIEWAVEDYLTLRRGNKDVTWCQILTRILCCF